MSLALNKKLQSKISSWLDSETYDNMNLGDLDQINLFHAIAEFMLENNYIDEKFKDKLDSKLEQLK